MTLKLSLENANKVYNLVIKNFVDENGRGEFDEETPLLTAFTTAIEWLEESENAL